jgi:hypothetical protein
MGTLSFDTGQELLGIRERTVVPEQRGVYQVRLVAGLGGQAQTLADHPADAVHRPGWPGEGDHGGVGSHDVFVGDPKSLAIGRNTLQLRGPLACVSLPEGTLGAA